jgi:hypothetical protein
MWRSPDVQPLPYAPNRGYRLRVDHMHVLREVAERAQVDGTALVYDEQAAAHAAELIDLGG